MNNIDGRTTRDIIRIEKTLIEQNFFHLWDTIYIQNKGLAMGNPTSSILSEVYLQYVENTTIYELLIRHKVEGYFRYVNDILVMYKEGNTNIHRLLEEFSNLATSMKFILEKEQNNRITFLDITTTKDHDLCYSWEHKTVAIRFYCNRMKM